MKVKDNILQQKNLENLQKWSDEWILDFKIEKCKSDAFKSKLSPTGLSNECGNPRKC